MTFSSAQVQQGIHRQQYGSLTIEAFQPKPFRLSMSLRATGTKNWFLEDDLGKLGSWKVRKILEDQTT
jgi:hypothetical protein